jgi:hypothetical protein
VRLLAALLAEGLVALQLPPDRERGALEVDVAPLEPEDLALPQPGRAGQDDQRRPAGALGRGPQPEDLARVDRPLLGPDILRRARLPGDIGGDQPPLEGLLQGAGDAAVAVAHRLRRQAALEEVGVEPLQLLGPQLLELHRPVGYQNSRFGLIPTKLPGGAVLWYAGSCR